MSRSNPYALDGFGEGFERGLRIVYMQQDREEAKLAREQASKDRAEDREMQKEEFGLRKEKLKLDTETARAEAKRKEEDAPFDRATKRAQANYYNTEAASNTEDTKQKRRQAGAEGYEGFVTGARQMAEHLGNVLEQDPDWGKKAATVRAGMESGQFTPELIDLGKQWLQETYSYKIQKGVDTQISDKTAAEQKVAKGSVIIGKTIKDFQVDPKTKEVAIILDVQVRQPDGTVISYDAPVTNNRTDNPDDEVMLVPARNLARVFEEATKIEMGLQGLEKEHGMSRQELLSAMRANTTRTKNKAQTVRSSAKEQEVARVARSLFEGDEALATLYVDGRFTAKDRIAAAKLIADNSTKTLTEEEIFDMADKVLGAGSSEQPSAGVVRKYNPDGSFTDVGGEASAAQAPAAPQPGVQRPVPAAQESEPLIRGIDTRTAQEKLRDRLKKNKVKLTEQHKG